jgi:hypothetical protein
MNWHASRVRDDAHGTKRRVCKAALLHAISGIFMSIYIDLDAPLRKHLADRVIFRRARGTMHAW